MNILLHENWMRKILPKKVTLKKKLSLRAKRGNPAYSMSSTRDALKFWIPTSLCSSGRHFGLLIIVGIHSNALLASTTLIHQPSPYQTYLLAQFTHLNGNHEQAQKHYQNVLQKTHNPLIYEGYAHHLFQTQQYPHLVTILPLLEKHMPHNIDIQLLCAHTLEIIGRRDEACKKLMALSAKFPQHPEVIYTTATNLAQNNQNDAALKLVDSFLSSTSETMKHFIFYFLKAQMYAALGNKQAALEHVKKCLELNAHFEQGWLLYGLLHELAGELDDALHGYNQCLQIMGSNDLLERQILQLQMRKHHADLSNNAQELFKKAHELFTAKNYQEAMNFIESILKTSKHLPTRLLKIEILCRTAHIPQALSLLQEWASAEPHNETWYKTIMLLYQAGAQPQKIVGIFKALEKIDSKNILPLLYQADFYLKNNQKTEAQQYLTKANALCTDPKIKARTLFQQALLYHEGNNNAQAQNILEEACALPYEFPPALNLLAYHYATHNGDLKKAQSLIEKALAKDPHNPHFLDTQAVIWHQKKEFDKAYTTLHALSEKLPTDCHVHQHLAQTVHAMSNQTVAQQTPHKASDGAMQKVVSLATKK